MVAHVPLELRAVGEGVAAVRATVVVLAGLVPILDVLLQRGVSLVSPGAVGASVQLGEGIWCACDGDIRGRSMEGDDSILPSCISFFSCLSPSCLITLKSFEVKLNLNKSFH